MEHASHEEGAGARIGFALLDLSPLHMRLSIAQQTGGLVIGWPFQLVCRF